MTAKRSQRGQEKKKLPENTDRDTIHEMKGYIKKLEKEIKKLRQENNKMKRSIGNTDKFMNKHAKSLNVADIVEELEDDLIVTGKIKDVRCPVCKGSVKVSNLPFGTLRVCENNGCDWREVIKE